jgi:hypothetical protein
MSRKTRGRLVRIAWSIAACGAVAWVLLTATGTRDVGLYGGRAGVFVRRDFLAIGVRAGWGWPSKAWMDRRHLRSRGEGPGVWQGLLGWGGVSGTQRWYGGRPVTITWVGLDIPAWYCMAIAAPPIVKRMRRPTRYRRRLRRRRERFAHWRHPACAGCGYDLRATGDRCPECGRPLPGQVLSIRRYEAGREDVRV